MKTPKDIVLRRVLVGHRAAVNVVDFDDRYIVSASGDRTIKVCQLCLCVHLHVRVCLCVCMCLFVCEHHFYAIATYLCPIFAIHVHCMSWWEVLTS